MRVRQLILGGALATVLFSCADRHIYQGDRYYESLAYSKAIPHYEKVYFKKPSNDFGVKLAESYYKTGDLKASEAVYERLVDANKTKGQHYFNYARVLMANGKYEKAKVVLGF